MANRAADTTAFSALFNTPVHGDGARREGSMRLGARGASRIIFRSLLVQRDIRGEFAQPRQTCRRVRRGRGPLGRLPPQTDATLFPNPGQPRAPEGHASSWLPLLRDFPGGLDSGTPDRTRPRHEAWLPAGLAETHPSSTLSRSRPPRVAAS